MIITAQAAFALELVRKLRPPLSLSPRVYWHRCVSESARVRVCPYRKLDS
ncbi:hypothetical protein TSAR_015036, partial [Trichomalopsis sarcophagae]